ncbi:radical SAM protein [bacterium]|nr:radical SAM protein [bacterium]
MRISELYQSVQGEGEYLGTPSVFLRTTGCNLRCWFCDTPFTSWQPEGSDVPLPVLLEKLLSFDCEHVVITGGEPLLPVEIEPLTAALNRVGRFLTIETAGTIFRPVSCDLMSISPKLQNSTPPATRSSRWAARHEALRYQPNVIRELIRRYRYQFKFVIDQPGDVTQVEDYLTTLPEVDRSRVWLMPQAVSAIELTEKSAWLEALAAESGFRFTSRWQIAEFGNVRGR